jgi:hypothetical protein
MEKERLRRTTKEVHDLKLRMLKAKKALPRGSVKLFINRFHEYNTYDDSCRVRMVHSLTIVDEEIIEKFELLAKEMR